MERELHKHDVNIICRGIDKGEEEPEEVPRLRNYLEQRGLKVYGPEDYGCGRSVIAGPVEGLQNSW